MENQSKFTVIISKAKCPFRFVIAFLGVSACVLLTSTRYNLSIAIVSMVKDSRTLGSSICHNNVQQRNTVSSNYSFNNDSFHNATYKLEKLKWTEEQQGLSLGAYYYGFAVTHVFGGRFSERYGSKWVTAIGLMGAALVNFTLPFAAHFNFILFVLLRVIIGCFHGIVHPSLFFMFKNWFPKNEQSFVLSMLLIGNALGLIINVPISIIVISNWPLLFYGGSCLHIIWFILWVFMTTDVPESHRMIKDKELCYIRQNSKNVLETNLHAVPWRQILKCKALYASIIAKLCWSFNHAIIIDNGPSYFNKIFGFNMLQASMHVAMIYMATVIIFLLSASLFSILDKLVPFSHTRLRKIFQAIVFLGASATMFVLPSVGCNEHLLQTLIIINMIMQGFTSVGEYPIINEFAGNYSGTVYGIAITFDSLARFLAPIIRGELVRKSNTLTNWNIVFYINAVLNLTGLIVFEICATTSLKNWALKKDFVRQISANGQIEKPIKKELKMELQNPYYRQDINTETEDWKEFKTSTLVQ